MQKGSELQQHVPGVRKYHALGHGCPVAAATQWPWLDEQRSRVPVHTHRTLLGPEGEGISTQATMPTSLEDALLSEMTVLAHTQAALTHRGTGKPGMLQSMGSQSRTWLSN